MQVPALLYSVPVLNKLNPLPADMDLSSRLSLLAELEEKEEEDMESWQAPAEPTATLFLLLYPTPPPLSALLCPLLSFFPSPLFKSSSKRV